MEKQKQEVGQCLCGFFLWKMLFISGVPCSILCVNNLKEKKNMNNALDQFQRP